MTTQNYPKVSVLMAVKDGGKYLRAAMDSILAQTFSDFEFIIIDDGSQDDTAGILASYSDPRIRIMMNHPGIGLTKSLNLGLENARGEYIARMDADDISLPQRFALQVSFLDSHPEIGVVGTSAYLIEAEVENKQLVQYPESHNLLHWLMCFFHNPIIHPSTMLRAQKIKDSGGYDISCVTSQDYNLWSRFVFNTRLANMEQICLYLRKHEENISRLKFQQQQQASLDIGTSLISRTLGNLILSSQLRSYCDFLWNGTPLPNSDVPFIASLIYRLAKVFLQECRTLPHEKLWIGADAINKLNTIRRGSNFSLLAQLNLNYRIFSVKYLLGKYLRK